MGTILTQEKLKEILFYNKETGLFVWKINQGKKIKAGSIAGGLDEEGYVAISIDGKRYKAHRLAWLYEYGILPERLDHKDNIKNHNWINNLRLATRPQNAQNSKLSINNKSGVKGVHWCKSEQKWIARISLDGKRKFLGFYDSVDKARKVIENVRNELHKEFARTV